MKKTKETATTELGPIVSICVKGIGPCGPTLTSIKKALIDIVGKYTGGEVLHVFIPSKKIDGDEVLNGVAYLKMRKDQARELVDRSKVDGGVFSIKMNEHLRFFIADRQMVSV